LNLLGRVRLCAIVSEGALDALCHSGALGCDLLLAFRALACLGLRDVLLHSFDRRSAGCLRLADGECVLEQLRKHAGVVVGELLPEVAGGDAHSLVAIVAFRDGRYVTVSTGQQTQEDLADLAPRRVGGLLLDQSDLPKLAVRQVVLLDAHTTGRRLLLDATVPTGASERLVQLAQHLGVRLRLGEATVHLAQHFEDVVAFEPEVPPQLASDLEQLVVSSAGLNRRADILKVGSRFLDGFKLADPTILLGLRQRLVAERMVNGEVEVEVFFVREVERFVGIDALVFLAVDVREVVLACFLIRQPRQVPQSVEVPLAPGGHGFAQALREKLPDDAVEQRRHGLGEGHVDGVARACGDLLAFVVDRLHVVVGRPDDAAAVERRCDLIRLGDVTLVYIKESAPHLLDIELRRRQRVLHKLSATQARALLGGYRRFREELPPVSLVL
jgi:hypothetical protein